MNVNYEVLVTGTWERTKTTKEDRKCYADFIEAIGKRRNMDIAIFGGRRFVNGTADRVKSEWPEDRVGIGTLRGTFTAKVVVPGSFNTEHRTLQRRAVQQLKDAMQDVTCRSPKLKDVKLRSVNRVRVEL